jgi:hypothetical protein
LFTDISIGRLVFSYHSLILTAAMTNIGVQSVFFWAFAIIIGSHTGLLRPDAAFANFRRYFSLERALAFGSLLIVLGLGAAVYALVYWYRLSFGEIAGDALIKTVCGASFLAVLGFQLIFSSFFICLLDQVPNQIAARVESDPARRTVAAAAGA